jgi:N-acetylglucosamine-6-phosphate deacetylase
MSFFSFSVKSLLHFDEVLTNQRVWIKDGYIDLIEDNSQDQPIDYDATLVPGFIDIQVNGGNGYLFNESPTLEAIHQIGEAHQRYGVVGWLPTLITDSTEKMQQAADAVALARQQQVPGVLGIHFEGPGLSVEKKGVHNADLIRSLSDLEIDIMTRPDLGNVIVTLAPEGVEKKVITYLRDSGVKVCLGHSNVSFQKARQAIDAGASGFTHLFNAMSPLGTRDPGMVGAALSCKESYVGLILDGVHVHPVTAEFAIQLQENIMLVSDAMSPVGTDLQSFRLQGETITRRGDQLTNEQGQIAGSVLNMAKAVENARLMIGLPLAKAVRLASQNPATFLGLDNQYGSLDKGRKANMVLLDDNSNVIASWIDGNNIF